MKWKSLAQASVLAVALAIGSIVPASAQQYEYEPGEGLHQEEWYDPSDWFKEDWATNYEADRWDNGYDDYDYGRYDTYDYDYGGDYSIGDDIDQQQWWNPADWFDERPAYNLFSDDYYDGYGYGDVGYDTDWTDNDWGYDYWNNDWDGGDDVW